VLLEPEVVVVADCVAKQALVIGGGGRAHARRDVERATRKVLVELGERVAARDGIEIRVLQRHLAYAAEGCQRQPTHAA
jgi:hypothetical protein